VPKRSQSRIFNIYQLYVLLVLQFYLKCVTLNTEATALFHSVILCGILLLLCLASFKILLNDTIQLKFQKQWLPVLQYSSVSKGLMITTPKIIIIV